jgi:hypothetical protein
LYGSGSADEAQRKSIGLARRIRRAASEFWGDHCERCASSHILRADLERRRQATRVSWKARGAGGKNENCHDGKPVLSYPRQLLHVLAYLTFRTSESSQHEGSDPKARWSFDFVRLVSARGYHAVRTIAIRQATRLGSDADVVAETGSTHCHAAEMALRL